MLIMSAGVVSRCVYSVHNEVAQGRCELKCSYPSHALLLKNLGSFQIFARHNWSTFFRFHRHYAILCCKYFWTADLAKKCS